MIFLQFWSNSFLNLVQNQLYFHVGMMASTEKAQISLDFARFLQPQKCIDWPKLGLEIKIPTYTVILAYWYGILDDF